MIKFLFIFSIFLTFQSISQESRMDEPVPVGLLKLKKADIITELNFFIGKDFDSIDIEVFGGGSDIRVIIIRAFNNEHVLTYSDLYNQLLAIKIAGGSAYESSRRILIKLNPYKTLPATEENWESMKLTLRELGELEFQIKPIDDLVKSHFDPNRTLWEVLGETAIELKEIEKDRIEIEQSKTNDCFKELLGRDEIVDIERYKKMSSEQNKLIVIYFTGYGCVNCRKLEEGVFRNSAICMSLNEDFIFISAHIDSQKELPKGLQGSKMIEGKEYDILTYGEYNRYFQLSQFKSLYQPYLVFMNSDGEILGTADYEHNASVQEMKQTIEEVKSKFKR